MKYMGSKNRHAKEILSFILPHRKPDQIFYDLFAGGFNMIDKVSSPRVANDFNKYVVALFRELQKPDFKFPEHIGEEKYKHIQQNKDLYPDWLVGYVGFNLSFGAMFFSTYRRDSGGVRNYEQETIRNLTKQIPKIQNIEIYNLSYDKVLIQPNSIIYCDPPYKGTAKYKNVGDFDYDKFYDWCRNKYKEGHLIFISEYTMPDDFTVIWEKKVNNSLTKDTGGKQGTEKLFTLNKELFVNKEINLEDIWD